MDYKNHPLYIEASAAEKKEIDQFYKSRIEAKEKLKKADHLPIKLGKKNHLIYNDKEFTRYKFFKQFRKTNDKYTIEHADFEYINSAVILKMFGTIQAANFRHTNAADQEIALIGALLLQDYQAAALIENFWPVWQYCGVPEIIRKPRTTFFRYQFMENGDNFICKQSSSGWIDIARKINIYKEIESCLPLLLSYHSGEYLAYPIDLFGQLLNELETIEISDWWAFKWEKLFDYNRHTADIVIPKNEIIIRKGEK